MENNKIIKNVKTPCYILNFNELDKNFNSLLEALNKYWDNYIIGYSYKTNALPWLIDYFDKHNCYSEVVSEDEYNLGKKLGVSNDKFIYNGPVKSKESFFEALENKCVVNIDSKRELEWLCDSKKKYGVGIRVNFDIEKYCNNQSQCGEEGGRFGFCYENGELKKTIDVLKSNGVSVSGLHMHVSSKTRSLDIYKVISEVAVKIIKEYDLNLKYIDVGGGFFGGMPNKPQFSDYLKVISETLKTSLNPHKTTLIVEPGISLIGSPFSYITTVIDTKDTTYNRFVIIDGSRTNVDPLMNKNNYFHEYIYCDDKRSIIKKQVICGYTCMEHDRLYTENDCNEFKVGDKIIFNKVGAYSMCLTPLFISYFPDVYLLKDKELKLVRSRWTANEYIQNSRIGDE